MIQVEAAPYFSPFLEWWYKGDDVYDDDDDDDEWWCL